MLIAHGEGPAPKISTKRTNALYTPAAHAARHACRRPHTPRLQHRPGRGATRRRCRGDPHDGGGRAGRRPAGGAVPRVTAVAVAVVVGEEEVGDDEKRRAEHNHRRAEPDERGQLRCSKRERSL